MLAAMGDGSGPEVYGGGTGQLWLLDPIQGFGHLRFTVPSFIGNQAYAHWAIRTPALQQGNVYEYPIGYSSGPEPTQLLGWKFAALMDYDWYDNAPDVSFELIDKCPAGGGEVLVLWAKTTTHKARMRMRGSSDMTSKYHNRCLWLRATVHHADGIFGLYMMDYSYTNSRSYHDM